MCPLSQKPLVARELFLATQSSRMSVDLLDNVLDAHSLCIELHLLPILYYQQSVFLSVVLEYQSLLHVLNLSSRKLLAVDD
jgi:hypothetical protein